MKKTILLGIFSLLMCTALAFGAYAADTVLPAASVDGYETFGVYNGQNDTFTVSVYYTQTGAVIDTAAFGFKANTARMTFSSLTYADGIYGLSADGIGYYQNENGVIADQWYKKGGIDVSARVHVADIVYAMTRENYLQFNPAADFVAYYDGAAHDYASTGTAYLSVLHLASLEITANPITVQVLSDISTAEVSVTYDPEQCSVDFSATSPYKKDIVFTVSSIDGAELSGVTYHTTDDTAEKTLSPVNGTYTIPASAVTGDVIITVTHVKREPGDVNSDSIIDIRDVTRLLKYLAGQDVILAAGTADLNGDGSITANDCAALLTMLVQ